jgi:hypothetical protein
MMLVSSPFHRANSPASPVSLGCGSFVLVRRSALHAVGGYAAVRNRINEDGWLLRVLKRAGFRTGAGDGSTVVRTRLYRSLGEIWHGFGKSMFPAMNFSLARTLGTFLSLALLGPGTLAIFLAAVIALRRDPVAELWQWMAVAAWAGQLGTMLFFGRRLKVGPVYALLTALGLFVASLILLQSTWNLKSGRGVPWKGRRVRHLPLDLQTHSPRGPNGD